MMQRSIPKPNLQHARDVKSNALQEIHKGKNLKSLKAAERDDLLLMLAFKLGVMDENGNVLSPDAQ